MVAVLCEARWSQLLVTLKQVGRDEEKVGAALDYRHIFRLALLCFE